MIASEVSFTSLCYITEDYDGRVWLHRLADIENNSLHTPFKSNRTDNYFENRDRLYRNDGPSAIGSVGVWDWDAIPNRDNPDIDYVQSYYVPDISPIRVVFIKANSLEELVEQLRCGAIHTLPYICDTLFCYQPQWGRLTGVLCKSNEFQISDKRVLLSEDVYTLPCYSIRTSDIYNWEDKNLRFLRELQIGTPSDYISIRNTHEIIRTLILERITWSLFKECIGATKAEWRNSKTLLEKISSKSLYEAVSEKLKCTLEQAKRAVDDFVSRANTLIDIGDIDSDVLGRIALQHDELRAKCEETVSQKWKDSHKAEIDKAEAEVAAIRDKAKQEQDESEKHLLDIKEAISTAEQIRSDVLSDISASQDKLKQLQEEIARYENLGKDALVAVRQRIAEAQKDMAGFIADLSVVLPQSTNYSGSEKRVSLWQYTGATSNSYSDDEIELAENWGDELNAISQSLSSALSVETELCSMFAAFLYSAHIHNVPLLIAGPGGHDIANVLAVSLYADGAGQLTLGNEFGLDGVSGIENCNEHIFSVQNMFGKGWADIIPQTFTKLKKHVVWTHPYVEDMAIEPKGLYNYMIPILSECFVGSIPALEPWPGKRSDNFQAYVSKKKLPLRIAAFKRLGLSKMLLSQLELILSDAKAILDNPSKEKDMELLFGLLPICVLTGKVDILKDVLESEGNLSNSVRAEAERYIEEE